MGEFGNNIEELRAKLEQLILKNCISDKEVLSLSTLLDHYIVDYYTSTLKYRQVI